METKKSLLEQVNDKETALWSAVAVVFLVQAPHLAFVFAGISELPWSWLKITHGFIYAISIDIGVIYFAAKGKKAHTMIFMVVSAAVTLKYYLEKIQNGDVVSGVILVVIAIAPALLIYLISEELGIREEEKTIEDQILEMKANGSTYDEIAQVLKVGKERISKTLKKHAK